MSSVPAQEGRQWAPAAGQLSHSGQPKMPPAAEDTQCTQFPPENPDQCVHPEVPTGRLTQPLWQPPLCMDLVNICWQALLNRVSTPLHPRWWSASQTCRSFFPCTQTFLVSPMPSVYSCGCNLHSTVFTVHMTTVPSCPHRLCYFAFIALPQQRPVRHMQTQNLVWPWHSKMVNTLSMTQFSSSDTCIMPP